MRRSWPIAIGGVMVGLLTAQPALAHRFKCFATAQAAAVSGYCWMSGGVRPPDVPLLIHGPDGSTVLKTTTGPDGQFTFTAARRMDHHIIAQTMGHRAEWVVRAAELPASLPAGPTAADDMAATPADQADTEAVVEAAVARQIAPLREELAAFQDEVRFKDVLGGLGWIVGLFGLAAWAQVKLRPARK